MAEDKMTIKVSTDQLITASGEVHSMVSKLRSMFESVDGIISQSANYWEGNGNTAHRESYRRKQEMVMTALKRFDENATDLEKIAGVYVETEHKNEEISQQLPDDVIF